MLSMGTVPSIDEREYSKCGFALDLSVIDEQFALERSLQHAALRGDGAKGLIRSHEFEDVAEIESVSRVNQAAAFKSYLLPKAKIRQRY